MTKRNSQVTRKVKRRLASFKQDTRFFVHRSASRFARELESLLADIQAGVSDPSEGLALVVAFYEHDNDIFELADDSSGYIGDVFRYGARQLFQQYAKQLGDESQVVDIIFELLADDGYGVRDSVLNDTKQYLSESSMRTLFEKLRLRVKKQKRASDSWPMGSCQVLTLAEQLGDAKLYEKAYRESFNGKLSPSCIETVAEIHLANDDTSSALKWAQKLPMGPSIVDREALLLRVYIASRNTDEAAKIAWSVFRHSISTQALDTLVSILGEGERESVIDEAVAVLQSKEHWISNDAIFLLEVGRFDEAQTHIFRLARQLDGDVYDGILQLAEAMQEDGRYLCASILYRALLESILRRAQSRYYHHGVRYLKKLDRLAKKIGDWENFETHPAYRAALQETHKLKYSFWRRLNA